MRQKRNKRHRKAVRFYSAAFGFRAPYKVLCDGTFVHHLLCHGLTPADDALSHLLGARALLFASRCIIAELRSLGKPYSESLEAAQLLVIARCDHEKRVSAAACIEEIVGEGNTEHFFVATQDTGLRKKFREVPGVPVIHGLKKSLFLEQPSSHQSEFVKSVEEEHLHMSESEFKKLHKSKLNKILRIDTTDSPAVDDDLVNDGVIVQPTKNTTARRMLGVVDKSKFKRKKAKGPNPLSCKKKKSSENSSVIQNQAGEAGGIAKRKRVRKRNKTHNSSKLGESGG